MQSPHVEPRLVVSPRRRWSRALLFAHFRLILSYCGLTLRCCRRHDVFTREAVDRRAHVPQVLTTNAALSIFLLHPAFSSQFSSYLSQETIILFNFSILNVYVAAGN